MKKIIICGLCNNEFKANSNTNLKTCNTCRSKAGKTRNYYNRRKIMIKNINNQFASIKVNLSNGRMNINVKDNYMKLGNSIEKLNDRKIYLKYLNNMQERVKSDIINLQDIFERDSLL